MEQELKYRQEKRLFILYFLLFLMNLTFSGTQVKIIPPGKFLCIQELEELQQSATLFMQKA